MNTNQTPRFRQILPGFYTIAWTVETMASEVTITRNNLGLWEVRDGERLVTLAGSLRDAKALAVTL